MENKIVKGKAENLKRKWKKCENERVTFYLLIYSFFYFFVCLFVFVFCFLLFEKPLKFVWGVPKWKISTGKKHISHPEK